MIWKKKEKLTKSGLILALCQDDTGIYNQLMYVEVNLQKQEFFANGVLGSSQRVYPDKICAAAYLDDICPKNVIDKFCMKVDNGRK